MARLTVDLELEQVRAIVRDLDSTLDPVRFARLHGGVSDVYRIDLAGAEKPLVLKIYGDEPAWIVAKEALVAGWIGERAGIPWPAILHRAVLSRSRMVVPVILRWRPCRAFPGIGAMGQSRRFCDLRVTSAFPRQRPKNRHCGTSQTWIRSRIVLGSIAVSGPAANGLAPSAVRIVERE
jgi:hypothetical protein